MGEIQNRPFQLSFNSSLKVDFQGSRVTSDAGSCKTLRSSKIQANRCRKRRFQFIPRRGSV